MKKVVKLSNRRHVYEIDDCAGCGRVIVGGCTEVGLPSHDNKEVRHIALCKSCGEVAGKEGIL